MHNTSFGQYTFVDIRGVNKKVAVEPFQVKGVEVKVSSGFGTVSQKTELTPLKVIFPNEATDRPDSDKLVLYPGNTVYVRGEASAHQWAKEVFELNGKKFIMLPEDMIVLVDRSTGQE